MPSFLESVVYSFLISMGVVLGASLFAGIGAIVSNHPPLKTMLDIAGSIKIWAVAAAMGGTFSSLEIIEKGLFKGDIKSIVKQALYIVSSLWGANIGYYIIHLFERCSEMWLR